MTFGEFSAFFVAAVGGGGVTKLVSKWLDGRRAKTKADADVATRALSIVEEQREDTQENATGWRECEKRCARLEAMCQGLAKRVEFLEGELRNANTKVVLLQRQAGALFTELDGLYKDLGRQRPSSRPPAPPSEQDDKPTMTGLRVVEVNASKARKRHTDH